MSLPVQIPTRSSRFMAHVEAKQFAVIESKAEIESVCNLPITKNIGDGLEIVSARKFGAHWRGYLKSKENPEWACFSEASIIANEFIRYIADKSPASDDIHNHIDNPAVIIDATFYVLKKINRIKLEQNSYFSDKAKLFGALVELIPNLSEQVYKGINRSIKYFANQRENFGYLSESQFAKFQSDYAESLKSVGPGIVDAITTELRELMAGARNV